MEGENKMTKTDEEILIIKSEGNVLELIRRVRKSERERMIKIIKRWFTNSDNVYDYSNLIKELEKTK